MRLDRQSIFAIVAMLVFAAGLGFVHIMLKGVNDDFGMGFGVGLLSGLALATAAIGWRRAGSR